MKAFYQFALSFLLSICLINTSEAATKNFRISNILTVIPTGPITIPTSISGFAAYQDFQGKRYFKSNATATWKVAARIADSLGGHLAIPKTTAENSFLIGYISGDSWIGVTDEAVEGTWVDIHGNALSYTNWNTGEPNNTNGLEHFGHLIKTLGNWDDAPNTSLYNFVVEFDGVETRNWTQISTITKSFTSNWNFTLAATDPTKEYKLIVSGTWGIANGVQHRDAAYECYSNTNIDTYFGNGTIPWANRACADGNNWKFNGSCPPLIPTYPSGYAGNHIYEYLLGKGISGGYPIDFADGALGDNSGSLTFTLFESTTTVPNLVTSSPYDLTVTNQNAGTRQSLSWSTSSTDKLNYFAVYRSENNGVNYKIIGKTNQSIFVDTTTIATKTYKYKVSEVDKFSTNNVLSAGQLNDFSFDNSPNDTYYSITTGTITGATLTNDRFGVEKSAYAFDGSSYIEYPSTVANLTSSNVFTISLWEYKTPSSTGTNLIAKYQNLDATLSQFVLNTNGAIGNGTNSFAFAEPPAGWNQYTVIFKSGTNNTKIYRNGILLLSSTLTYNAATTATKFFIGRISGGGFYSGFNGKIDDVKIFNRELSSTEVANLYSNESTTNTFSESSFSNVVNSVVSNKAIYVNKITGSDGNTGTAASPFATIQFAVNTASSGDTVIISDHTYTESLNITSTLDKLTIASRYILDSDSSHTKLAIIDATNTAWANIHINSSSNLFFKGISFKNAKGRLLSASGKNISFSTCQISNLGYTNANITTNAIIATNVYMDSTLVFNNNYIEGIVTADSVSFTNSKFFNNNAGFIRNSGGGFNIAAYIFNSTISNNSRLMGSGSSMGDYFIINANRQHVIRNKFSNNNYMNILSGSNVSYQKIINNLFYKTIGTAIGRTVHSTSLDSLILIHNTFIDNTGDFTAHPNGFWQGLIYNNIFTSSVTFSGPSPSGFDLIHFKMLGNLFTTFPTFNQIDTSGSFQNSLFTSIQYKDPTNLDYTYDDTEPRLGNGYLISYPVYDDINGTPRPNPLGTKPEVGAFESKKSATSPASPVLLAPVSNDKRVILTWTDPNVSGTVKYRIYKDSVSIAGSTPSNINNGLIAYFPFTGNILDSSGKGNTLTQNSTSLVNDRFAVSNRAYNLTGTNSNFQSTTLSEEVTNKSFSAWVRLSNTAQTGGGLIGLQSTTGSYFDAIVYNETNQGWGFGSDYFGRSKWSGVKEASTTNWVHMTATYEANLYKLYRNGILIDSTKNFTITRFPTTSKINIGKRHDGGANAYLAGDVDDVRLYNRSLTASEVLNLFNYESKNYAERSNSGTNINYYKEVNSPTLTYTDTVYGYKKYYYRVTAINANGVESDLSNEASITTQAVADIKQVCVGGTTSLVSNSSTSWTQVGVPLTKAMTAAWSATLAGTDPNKKYKLVVSGTWGIANGVQHRDAAYSSTSSSIAITAVGSNPVANRGCDANWLFEGSCPPPVPSSPSGYASDNTYEYLIGNGKSAGFAIAFADGSYGDNTGSLTFTLYESAAGSATTLLSTTTKAMTAAWSANLAATDPNKKYKMIVSGTWGIANGVQHRDAAYASTSSSVAITAVGSNPVANRGCDANWLFEGSCPPPVPSSPSGYAIDNIYEYIIGNGKVGGYTIAFEDGSYGDNSGSLTFKLYEFTDGIWSSSDPTIATVNSIGVVTGVAPGSARILYTTTNGSGNSSDIQTVNVNDIPAKPVVTGGVWKLITSSSNPMTSAWNVNFASSSTKKYKLVVSGTWGIANGVRHRDAAYASTSSSVAITATGSNPVANRGCDANWSLDGVCPPPTPTTPSTYSSSNTYEYYLGYGKPAGFTIAFTDGTYNDNSGSLTFDYYELSEIAIDKICVNTSVELVPSPLAGHSMRWYTAASGGSSSYIQPAVTTNAAASTNYYASQVNDLNSCESQRQLVTTIVNANPATPVVPVSGITLYQFANASALLVDTTVGNSAFWYTTLSGIGSLVSPIPSTATPGSTNYFVSQKSITSNCESAKATYTVVVSTLPALPTTMLPTNNQVKTATLPKFSWSRASGVTFYNAIVSKDSNFASSIIDTIITDTQFISSKILTNNTIYYWKVKVKDANTFVAWSNIYKFQTYVAAPISSSISALGNVNTYNWTVADTSYLKSFKIYRDSLPFITDSSFSNRLIAYYGLNGNATDSSVTKNNGTVIGATLVADRFGLPNSAYNFNGTSNYISIPGKTTNDLTSNFTISTWVNVANGFAGGQVLGKWGIGGANNAAYGLAINSTGNIIFNTNDGVSNYGLTTTGAISFNSWHHLVVKLSGDTLSIYSDNVLLNSATGIRYAQASKYTLDIGWEAYGRYQYFKGKLDDIRLYTRALSEYEIGKLYNTEGTIPSLRTSSNNDPAKLVATVSKSVYSLLDTVAVYKPTYYYRVSAVNNDNIESDLSGEVKINLYKAPVLISPLINSAKQSITPKFVWNTALNNSTYQLQLSTDSTFISNVILDSTVIDSSYTMTTSLRKNSNYYWRARVKGVSSISNWSTTNKFQTYILAPTSRSISALGNINTYSWTTSDSSNLKSFNIYRDSLPINVNSVFSNKLVATVSRTLYTIIDTALIYKPFYYYRVSAVNNDNIESDLSDELRINLYNTPILTSPLNGSTKQAITPKFIWNASGNNPTYQLQLSTDSNFASNIIVDSTIVDSTFTFPANLLRNTNYYWRTRAKGVSSVTNWTATNKFQTYILPPQLNAISGIGKVVNYSWSQIEKTNINSFKIYRDTIPFTPGKELDSVLLSGLVAYYGFDGNANDSSTYKNNAVVTGATLVTDRFGAANSAYDFNGTSNYITVPGKTTNDLTSNYTISLWVYAPTGLKGGQILGKWGIGGVNNAAYGLAINSTGNLIITNNDGISNYGLITTKGIALDKWHQVVVRYAGDTLSIFSDNTLLDYKTGIKKAQASKYTLDIGWEAYGRYQYFKGKLDDIRLYKRALADNEISALYNYENVIPLNRTSNNNDSTKLVATVSSAIFSILDTAKENTTYYYRTSAVNNDKVESTLSNEATIKTYGKPILLSPINNTFNVSQTPKLSWGDQSVNIKHQLQVSTDSTFTARNIILDSASLDSNFLFKNNLTTNTGYYWRVKTIGKSSISDWSTTFKFTTNLPVPSFTNLSGGNKVDTLTWTYSDTSIIKYFKIYRDTSAIPTIALDSVISKTLTYIDNNNLALNTKYYYRITAIDKNGIESNYSATKNVVLVNKKPIVAVINNKNFNNVGEYNFVKYTLDASSSKDLDGSIVSYNWYVNDSLVNTKDSIISYVFRQGTNEVKIVVTDNDGDKDSSYSYISATAFVKQFSGGFLAGISAVSPNLIYTSDSTYNPATGASVYLLNRSGDVIYPLIVSTKVYTTPSVASDSSVFITSGSNLYGFTKTGAPLWSIIPLGGNSFVTPTIDSVLQRLYVGVSNKNFFGIDYKTGKVAWNLMSDAPINTSAVITGDRKLVFTSEAGTLYGFDIFTNGVQTAPKWKISFGDIVTKSPAVDNSNNIYIGTNTGRLIKLSLNNDGTVTIKWNITLPSPIQSSPVIDADGYIYVGQDNGDFSKVNPANGQVIWTFSTYTRISSAPFINQYGTIYIANELGYVYAIDANKNLKWKYQDVNGIVANILYTNGMLYFGSLSGTFTAIYDNPNSVAINTSIFSNPIGSTIASQSIKTNVTPTMPIIGRDPIWGTFQGNYRRTGSKAIDCPTKPLLITSNGKTSFCEYDSLKISFTDTVTSFVWKLDTTKLSSASKTITTNKVGSYSLGVTNIYGCTTYSDSLKLNTIPRPSVPVITRDLDGKLVSSYSTGNIWFKDGGTISDTAQSIKPSSVGNYTLKTIQNTCISNFSTSYYYIITDVVNLENGQFVKLNPNPFVSQLILSFSVNGHTTLNADVYDLASSRKIVSRLNVSSNRDLDLANLASGNYVIKVYSSDLKINTVFKIIKL